MPLAYSSYIVCPQERDNINKASEWLKYVEIKGKMRHRQQNST